jgi:hypothetical protein
VRPIFEQAAWLPPGESVERTDRIGAEAGESGQIMGAGKDVDAVDLVQVEAVNCGEELAGADGAGLARLRQALGGERDPASGGE